MKTKIITFNLILILCYTFFTEYCESQWIKANGPGGGTNFYSSTVSGSTIFVGTDGGIYRSEDYGISWTLTSPNYGRVRTVASNGSYIYAGTSNYGVRVSTDKGTTWNATTVNYGIYAVATSGPYVFAATNNAGLYRSTDYGQNWNRVTALPVQDFYSLAVDDALIYAGSENGGYGVYRSTDYGDTWVQTSLTNRNIHSLAINGSSVFAGGESYYINYGIYGSNDYGATWPIRALTNRDIVSLTVCGGYIFAGDGEDPTGVYRSSDNGETWIQTELNNVELNLNSISFIGSTILAGTTQECFISSDYGEKWPIHSGALLRSTVYSLAASGTNIFAGTDYSVHNTSDNGQSWMRGLGRRAYSLIVNNSDIFAGTYSYGVYQSSDNGQTWSQTSLNNMTVNALAVSGGNILAGTSSYGVYLSSDNGQTWSQTPLNNRTVYSIAVSDSNILAGVSSYGVYLSTDNGQTWSQSPLNNRTVNALAVSGSNILAGTSSYGVYLSSDNGQTWSQTPLNNRTIKTFSSSGNYVLAGASSYGVYLSSDNGQTWSQAGINSYTINSILIKDNIIYAGTSGNAVWKRLLSDIISPNLISPVNDSVVNTFSPALNWGSMNGVSYYSLKVSKDTNFTSTVVNETNIIGQNYTINSGILEDSTYYFWKVSAMGGAWSDIWKFKVVIPITPQYTTDKIEILKGNILDLLNSNIISQEIYEMLVSKLNNAIQQIEQQHYKIAINSIEQFIFEINLLNKKLILTTEQAQPLLTQANIIIYMLNILDGSENNLLAITNEQAKVYKLNQNYPNPFNPTTTIKFSIAKNSAVNLSVYDICGKLVNKIVNTRLEAGSYEYIFNGVNLASGIYFYKLVTENFTDIKKMVLVK